MKSKNEMTLQKVTCTNSCLLTDRPNIRNVGGVYMQLQIGLRKSNY